MTFSLRSTTVCVGVLTAAVLVFDLPTRAETIGVPTSNLGNRRFTHPMAARVYIDQSRPLTPIHESTYSRTPATPGTLYMSADAVNTMTGIRDTVYDAGADSRRMIAQTVDYPNSQRARDFPNSGRADNRSIVQDMPNRDRMTNREYVDTFPNRDRPDQRDFQRQRQEQARDLTEYIENDEVLITLAGIQPHEAEDFARILLDEFGMIEQIKPLNLPGGLSGFAIRLDGDALQLSELMQSRDYGPFSLGLVQFRKRQMDFSLKTGPNTPDTLPGAGDAVLVK